MGDQVDDQSCFVPGISVSFQNSYFYYTNWIAPVTMLLSVWCVVSNASVIIALFRSGIRPVPPGLLMVGSLTITDLIWGATVAPVNAGFRLKHFMNKQVCEVYSELAETPVDVIIGVPVTVYVLSTFGNLAVISVDRYLAVHKVAQYKFLVTRRRALAACFLVWIMSVTVGTLRQVGIVPKYPLVFFGAGFIILTTAVIIIAQIMTIRCLHLHNSTVAEMLAEGNQANPVNTPNAAIERALTKTTTYVVGALALIFIPAFCVMVASFITKKPLLKFVNPILHLLVTLCSGINPVLYYRGNKKVKEGISKLVKC